jgi:hypothetical protein
MQMSHPQLTVPTPLANGFELNQEQLQLGNMRSPSKTIPVRDTSLTGPADTADTLIDVGLEPSPTSTSSATPRSGPGSPSVSSWALQALLSRALALFLCGRRPATSEATSEAEPEPEAGEAAGALTGGGIGSDCDSAPPLAAACAGGAVYRGQAQAWSREPFYEPRGGRCAEPRGGLPASPHAANAPGSPRRGGLGGRRLAQAARVSGTVAEAAAAAAAAVGLGPTTASPPMTSPPTALALADLPLSAQARGAAAGGAAVAVAGAVTPSSGLAGQAPG